jgi:hypothetical protein
VICSVADDISSTLTVIPQTTNFRLKDRVSVSGPYTGHASWVSPLRLFVFFLRDFFPVNEITAAVLAIFKFRLAHA